MANELETKIANIPTGKTFGSIGQQRTCIVRKLAGGQYQIDAAWEVSEAHDDDADSYTYHPFKHPSGSPRSGVCWVGRRVTTKNVAEAATAYEEFKSLINSHAVPTRGEVIGSVRR